MMRRLGTMALGLAAMTIGFAGSSALSSTAPSARSPAPLRALSEQDQTSTRETGCTCSFAMGRSTLVQMIGNEFMIRTSAGRRACRITHAQFGTLSDARGSTTCAGLRLTLKRTGRIRQYPEADSFQGPASLTVAQGRASRVLAGNWGCAC